MSVLIDALIIGTLIVGTAFIVVGTIGVLRFGDLPTRLHAVAKADNLGLGFIVVALIIAVFGTDGAPGEGGLATAAKLLLIWLLALLGTAANSHLLAHPPAQDDPPTDTPEDES